MLNHFLAKDGRLFAQRIRPQLQARWFSLAPSSSVGFKREEVFCKGFLHFTSSVEHG